MRQLSTGTKRNSELRHAIGGISEKMLAQTLRDLERTGLITRRSYPVVPPRVEYSLTSLGVGCAQLISPLLRFVEANVRSFYGAQQAHTTGDAVEAGDERQAG
jgi:DNA-binding HxlR family transcriptional regulator